MDLEHETVQRVSSDLTARRDEWVEILAELIRIPSENPPGDTVKVSQYLRGEFESRGIPYEVIAPQEKKPNVVAHFEGEQNDDRDLHLVFNGHLDTFPVSNPESWDHDPFGGEIQDGRIYGRGAADMYGGFVASLASFIVLFEHKSQIPGEVTFAAVSDEETGGKWGTRYLVENYPEYRGSAVIVGEPSSNEIIRFGGRGIVWAEVSVRGESGHSAFPEGVNAIEMLIDYLDAVKEKVDGNSPVPERIRKLIYEGQTQMDEKFGPGATEQVLQTQANVNKISGGEVINITPEHASASIDVRLPIGASGEEVISTFRDFAQRNRNRIKIDILEHSDATYSDVNHPILKLMQKSAEHVRNGHSPVFLCGLPMTDARFYRQLEIPVAIYGPSPNYIGSQDEHIALDDFMEIVNSQGLAAISYLLEGT